MLVLNRRRTVEAGQPHSLSARARPARAEAEPDGAAGGQRFDGALSQRRLLKSCSNPECGTGWLHLWRDRSTPVFEGGWSCSPACTAARVASALRREIEGRAAAPAAHRHRIPLGLVMLEQGWITQSQLRGALEAQRAAGAGRLGQWLVRHQGVSEQLVARALGLQWSCPAMSLEFHDAEAMGPLVPRLFLDAFGALPLRVAAGRILYLGFEGRPDPVLSLAVERMTGLQVESGLVRESHFRQAHARMLESSFPAVELIETSSEPVLAKALAVAVERHRPLQARLARVHDCLWLRMWLRPFHGPVPEKDGLRDVIASLAPH